MEPLLANHAANITNDAIAQREHAIKQRYQKAIEQTDELILAAARDCCQCITVSALTFGMDEQEWEDCSHHLTLSLSKRGFKVEKPGRPSETSGVTMTVTWIYSNTR